MSSDTFNIPVQPFLFFRTMSQQPEQRRKWHFDRTVNIPSIATAATIVVTVGLYLTNMDKNQQLMQQQLNNQQKQIEQMQQVLGEGGAPVRRDIEKIQQDLRSLSDKLDKIILEGIFKSARK